MKSFRPAFLVALICFFLSSPAWAIWVSANSFVYFDAQGNVIGQSIISCTNSIRQYEGTTSIYWREDSMNCENSTLNGWSCSWKAENGPSGTSVWPTGGWNCNPIVNYVQPYPPIQTSQEYLPPGMTLEQSCTKVGCDRPDQFLGQWTTAPQADLTNSSLPPQLR